MRRRCDFAYRGRYYHSVSVCLSVTFVHCTQTAENIVKISFAYNDSVMSHPDRVKIWLTSIEPPPSFPNFCQKWPTSVDLNVVDIRRQSAAEWLEIAQCSQIFTMPIGNHYLPPHAKNSFVPSISAGTFGSPQDYFHRIRSLLIDFHFLNFISSIFIFQVTCSQIY